MNQDKRYTTAYAVRMLVFSMVVATALGLSTEFIKNSNIKTLISILIPQVMYLAIPLIMIKRDKFNIKNIVPYDLGVYPLGILLTLPIAIAALAQNLVFAISFDWLANALNIGFDITLDLSNPWYLVFGLLIISLLPAISEEFMFRGVIMSSLRDRGFWYTVFVSATVFALAHMNVKQLIHPFLLGAILAFITLKTSNIAYAMCIHFINNVVALFLYQIPFFANLTVYSPKNLGILFGIMFAGIAVLYPTIWLLLKATQSSQRFKKYSEPTQYEKASEKPAKTVEKPILFLCLALTALMIIAAVMTFVQNTKG